MLSNLKVIFSNVNILLLVFIISIYLTFFKIYRVLGQKKKTVRNYTLCFLITFIHLFVYLLFLGFSIKLFILPIKRVEYILVVIFILLLIYLGFCFKRCFLTILENKCLNLSQDHTWMGKRLDNDISNITIKKGFVSREFTNGNKGPLLLVIILSFKYLIEILVNSNYYK